MWTYFYPGLASGCVALHCRYVAGDVVVVVVYTIQLSDASLWFISCGTRYLDGLTDRPIVTTISKLMSCPLACCRTIISHRVSDMNRSLSLSNTE